jgi:hypothetical protein
VVVAHAEIFVRAGQASAFVFVEDAAETIMSSYIQVRHPGRISDLCG